MSLSIKGYLRILTNKIRYNSSVSLPGAVVLFEHLTLWLTDRS